MRTCYIVLLIFCLAGFPALCRAEPETGKPAPALAAKELDGSSFDLAALRGKVVIVHFWATWCPSCREEMAALNRFYADYASRGVAIICVTLDKPRKRDEVQEMMKSFTFPAAMLSDTSVNGYGTPAAIPVTYIIDKNGILRARLTPEEQVLTVKELEDTVGPLLK